ncbi:MAG: hypothetical protein WCO66_01295 [Candidatus Absconditabacteria bacterium]
MQLFKRILLSLFPEENAHQTINPASMFISFISTKEFFSVINRKIVENYKLNLFDVSCDPFEFKIGFGKNIQVKQKDIENYYAYCSAANMNGYKFYNPANIGNSISLVAAIITKDSFSKYPQEFFLNFLYTCYLLVFIFAAKLKSFPFETKQENYNRFIELFFNFYAFIFSQTGQKIEGKELDELKKNISKQIDVFFFLFYTYQRFGKAFCADKVPSKDFYMRLFGDDIKKEDEELLGYFIKTSEKCIHSPKFGNIENKLLQYILPADILIRYLLLDTNIFLAIEHMVSKIYTKEKLDTYLKSFLKDDSQREACIDYITNHKHFKKNFFQGVQKYVITLFQKENPDNNREDDLDDLSSRIGEDVAEGKEEDIKIPERIKKESKIMEKILNFYITFLGGFWIARGENFFLRLHKNDLLRDLTKTYTLKKMKEKTISFYGGMLYLYGKNIFYYKYISENVKLGRQRFYLPYKSTSKKTYSNREILRLFDESCLSILLQDINTKDLKIYAKSKKLLGLFKDHFGKTISMMSQNEKTKLIKTIYKPLHTLIPKRKLIDNLQIHLNENDIYHLKENIYNLDFWIHQGLYTKLYKHKAYISKNYDETALLGILAKARESLFGYLLFQTQVKKSKKNLKSDLIRDVYLNEILHIETKQQDTQLRGGIIEEIESEIKPFLEIIVTMDENEDFIRIGTESRKYFIENKEGEDIKRELSGEDILRISGYFKNITYYNKRFLLPT